MSQNQQEQSEAKLLAFIEGELDAEGRAEIEKHLAAHPQHRRLLAEMRGMRDWVRWLPKETAPAELAEAFQGRMERNMLLGPPDATPSNPRMRINFWPQLRAAAAVIGLALGLGAIVYFALPARHNPFAAATTGRPPVNKTGSPRASLESLPTTVAAKPTDSMDLDAPAPAVQRDTADKKADLSLPAKPTSHPTELALVKALRSDENEKLAVESAEGRVGGMREMDRASTDPGLGEPKYKAVEPTDQLAQIARSTYSLVSDDPKLAGLLQYSYGRGTGGGGRGFAPSVGSAATDASKLETFAKATPAPISAPQPGSSQSNLRGSAPKQTVETRRPFVMVVLAADTDRARKQIGDYLADNGISTQVVNDSYGLGALDDSFRAMHGEDAAASVPPAAPAVAPESFAGSARPSEPAPAGAAAPLAPAPTTRRAVAAAPLRDVDDRRRSLTTAPAATPATTPAPAFALGATSAPSARTMGEELGRKYAGKDTLSENRGAPGLPSSDGNILIARQMTARQAAELRANLRQPQVSQWAAVYSEAPEGLSTLKRLGDLPATNPSNRTVFKPQNPSTAPAGFAYQPSTTTQPAAQAYDSTVKGQVQARTPSSREAETKPVNLAARLPESVQQSITQAAATTRQAGKPQPVASPVAPPLPSIVTPAAPPGASGGRSPVDQAVFRDRLGMPTTVPSNKPGTQPSLDQAVDGLPRDEQAFDVVIVLQQSQATATTQPAAR